MARTASPKAPQVQLSEEGVTALEELRTLLPFSRETEADILSPLIIAERDRRQKVLEKFAKAARNGGVSAPAGASNGTFTAS